MLRALFRRLIHWLRGSPPSPDPHALVREPIRKGPAGRTSAVAVAEPPPPADVRAIGRR